MCPMLTDCSLQENQVTPFSLDTPDGETLYLWHILPIALYSQHEDTLSEASRVPRDKYTSSDAFRLLKEDPEARLIISCKSKFALSFSSDSRTNHIDFTKVHGNAGHVAQNTRAPQYRLLSGASPHMHMIALDYRGYGHSTGTPSEEGLITDAATVVEFALNTLKIPPSRIVLLGQSLGTAVASATAEKFSREKGIDFAGVVLVASFSSLPTMLANYSLGGVIPLLRPLGIVPPLLRTVLRFIVDKWPTLDRLMALVTQVHERNGRLRLHLIHAVDDWDIPYVESVKIFEAAAKASLRTEPGPVDESTFAEMKDARTLVKGKKAFKTTWKSEGDVVITHEQFAYGGELTHLFTRGFFFAPLI